nr:hypothetical protein [Tanacetum cinerariifolium]
EEGRVGLQEKLPEILKLLSGLTSITLEYQSFTVDRNVDDFLVTENVGMILGQPVHTNDDIKTIEFNRHEIKHLVPKMKCVRMVVRCYLPERGSSVPIDLFAAFALTQPEEGRVGLQEKLPEILRLLSGLTSITLEYQSFTVDRNVDDFLVTENVGMILGQLVHTNDDIKTIEFNRHEIKHLVPQMKCVRMVVRCYLPERGSSVPIDLFAAFALTQPVRSVTSN